MNRREALKLIASGLLGSTLDPEKLLWVPGKKSYVFFNSPIPVNVYESMEFDYIIWDYPPLSITEIQWELLNDEVNREQFFNRLSTHAWMTEKK